MSIERKTISKLGNIITGNTPPRKMPQYYGDAYPFIKPTDIDIDSRYTFNPEECYSQLGFEKYRTSIIPKDATCVVTIGSIGKKITMARTDCFINQAMNAVVPYPKYDAMYIFYLLKNNLTSVKYADSGTSSGRENVSKSALGHIEILVETDIEKQHRIASILSAYDDLIENNLCRIKLLEEAARCEYKMVLEKCRIVEKLTLNEILMNVKKLQSIRSDEYSKIAQFPIIDQSIDFIGGYTNDESKVYNNLQPVIVFGDHTRILKYINFPFATGADGTQIIKPKRQEISTAFLYFSLLDSHLQNYHYARHFKYLKEQIIMLPEDGALIDYRKVVDPHFELICVLRSQNTQLRQARDLLLPKIMSGEIDVEEIPGTIYNVDSYYEGSIAAEDEVTYQQTNK